MNIALAREILLQLSNLGLNEIVVCAGARNAPFVALLDQVRGVQVHAFFEERSAAFFALGRIRATGRPVAVCTTSGTAVAELLPAVIEADYQSLPLILLTADRPENYRGTGAPQTIVQPGIFSTYVEKCWDISRLGCEIAFSGVRPVHINVCFAEPLIDEPISPWEFESQKITRASAPRETVSISAQRPLVIVSGLAPSEAENLAPLLKSWRRPIYCEGTANLRGHPALEGLEVREPFSQMQLDGVIRIGNVPTLRYWRDLEANALPVWHFSRHGLSGLPRERTVYSLESLALVRSQFVDWEPSEREVSRRRLEQLTELLGEFPLSEPAWVRRLSQWIPEKALVFLGNSLPIREWDLAAVGGRGHQVEGNRGVNGIDGLVSTFIGLADRTRSNWAVMGDLSALYDLSGPWAARNRKKDDLNLVVINNGGGKIFSRMFNTSLFQNPHDLEFSSWAKMWSWDYQKITSLDDQLAPARGPRVIEIVPDSQQTNGFLDIWEKQR